MSHLRATVLIRADGPLIRLTGEIDRQSVGQLESALTQPGAARGATTTRVDLAGLSFCGSSGLRAFLVADERARSRGDALVLTNVPPAVARLFALTGADRRLTVEPGDAG
ncbi:MULTISPECIES: STAS domain-containing protein [Kitasatospora]|uniref:Anti-sigma factor antagonist n=2 Tax=Kitasatospora TaxID=2063 RepID=A0ABT1J365_9ACTN|nr:STAS domain-containing protein [Kitasatospora paracochleata]MCP2311808.1 anti-sigma B factor antagonist [Kitasatospora paracochleata]